MNAKSHPAKPRVAVLFGGRSSEHSISCVTAAGVLQAIDRSRFDVVPIGITKGGAWVQVADDFHALQLTDGAHLPQVPSSGPRVQVPNSPETPEWLLTDRVGSATSIGQVDVVLPLLHGPFGEDGTLQGLLELGDSRYVGSGVAASATMMDKQLAKVIFAAAGLPVGPYVTVTDKQWRRDPQECLHAVEALTFPVFVKPSRAGSSMGVSRVADPMLLRAAIEAAREHDPKVIIEQGIPGREVECGILEGRGSQPPLSSVVGEIEVLTGHDFYDFNAKYLDEGQVRLSAPANLPDTISAQIREMSLTAFEAAGCEGLARVDWFYTSDGQLILNEINTMPGFTPHSMFPALWQATGLDYPALISELIDLALARRVGLR